MRPTKTTFAAACMAALIPASVRADGLDVGYAITVAGLTMGKATLHADVIPGRRYETSLEASLKGLAGLLFEGEGKASSRGRIDGTRIRPRYFALDARYSGTPLVERMALDDGTVTSVEITPRPMDRPDRIPSKPEDRKDVVDPLSGLIGMRLSTDGKPGAGECDRTVPVNDGTTRFDVVLSKSDAPPLTLAAVPGDLVACDVRYVPISGHRPKGWAVKAMSENRDVRVWLAPVGTTGALAPARISVGTYLGSAVAEAVSWKVTPRPRR